MIYNCLVLLSFLNMTSSNCLRLCSFNCKGHGRDRIEYVKQLITKCDILLLQEHWYLECNLRSLESDIGNVNVVGVSGMDEHILLHGRPYGGCAFVYKKSLNCTVVPITTDSERFCACTLSVPSNARFLLT